MILMPEYYVRTEIAHRAEHPTGGNHKRTTRTRSALRNIVRGGLHIQTA